jgi:hypothetical protein
MTFGTALALERAVMLRINCEAVMWKITTRGFTLEEVLIMAAMNLLGDPITPENRRLPYGRGIYLMKTSMDESAFEEGGAVVYMRKASNATPGTGKKTA